MTTEETLAKAVSQGYKENFGPGGKTPEQFLADGEKIAGVQSKLNNNLKEEIEALKKTNEDTNQTLKEFMGQHHKATSEAFDRGYKKQLKDIKDKKIEAVAEADSDKFNKLDKEEDKLRATVKEHPKETVTVKTNPDFDVWLKDNQWYAKDDELRTAADIIDKQINPDGLTKRTPGYFKAIEKRIKTEYADKFDKIPANNLDTSDNTNVISKGKQDYENLPPEAKKVCDMFVKTQGVTKEDYCKNFDWRQV